MKKRILLLVVLVLAAGAGVGFWLYERSRAEPNPNRLLLYGNVDIREVALAFNNTEHIAEILVEEGDRVQQGQLLATLKKARLNAELATAQAGVAAQQATLARLLAGTRPEQIRKVRADLAARQAELVDAKQRFRRADNLFKKKMASAQERDDAEARLNLAQAEVKAAGEELALALAGPRVEDIDAARATLNAQEARLELAEVVLKEADLYAPHDGIIRDRIQEPGDLASPQRATLTLALTNPVWVRAYAPETALGRLKPGMRASITTDSYADKVYDGWVGFISPTAEFTPQTVETPDLRTKLVYQVRVYACNADDELRLGMPATVTIRLDGSPPADGKGPDCLAAASTASAD